jgi:hypothetical protein
MLNIFKAKATTQKRICAICGDEIPEGKGVQRDKQWFCSPWHAQQCRPRPPWWKRLFSSGDVSSGGGCC